MTRNAAQGVVATTRRLFLRRWELADMELIAPLYADPETMHYFGDGSTFSQVAVIDGFPALAADYATFGYGNYAVIEQRSGCIIGHCGVRYKPDRGRNEADWLIGKAWWGAGYGLEAAHAVFVRSFRVDCVPAIFGIAHRDNRPSIGLMKKLGMQHLDDIVANGVPSVVYGIDKHAFQVQAAVEVAL